MSKNLNLFDANGRFGCSSTCPPVYPTVSDLLSQLDRLGVSRSVVWNVESRDSNCPWSNRRLVDEIEKTPGAKGRLIPSFEISPTMIYECGAVDDLKESLKKSQTNALHFNHGLAFIAYKLRQIVPIIGEIKSLRPVVFLNVEETSVEDILYFADKFPEVYLVITEVSWSRYIVVFDMMRQRKNILVDTSMLHTWGAIEMVVEDFGPDRIVFGLGEKTHNGASIAEIARADISDEDRELITHGNLERLLGLKSLASGDIQKPTIQNTLWNRLLNGHVIDEEFVDAHGHLGPGGGYVLREHTMKGQIDQGLAGMDKLGVQTMIVSSMQALMSDPVNGNLEMEDALKSYGDRYKGYFAFNPHYAKELIAIMDDCFSRDVFVGFKILCDYWQLPITDSRFNSMWDYANCHRLPILIHTWEGPYDSPALLSEIVKKYPDASFLLAHGGGGDSGRHETEDIIQNNDNVYMEWCGTFCSSVPLEETLEKIGSQKVIFGSDGVCHSPVWELGRLLSLNVPEKDITPILGRNMKKLMERRIK